jgi:hypothetical protein
MPKAALKSKPVPLDFKTEPALHFFHFLASLREKLLAGTIARVGYSAALVDAAAAEHDDDWRELEAWHAAQRRARRRGRSR